MTREEAIKLADSEFWKDMTKAEIAEFQLFEDRLCMPFDVFHAAVEAILGRPVFTHEFANADYLRSELLGGRDAPDLEEILNLIPPEKLIVMTK